MPNIKRDDLLPRLAADAHLHILDDGGVLFSEGGQKLFAVNTVATFIWCLLEEDRRRDRVEAALTETFAITRQTAAEYVDGIVRQWAGCGVLAEGQTSVAGEAEASAPAASAAPSGATAPGPLPPYPDAPAHGDRRYRLLDSVFRLRFGSAEQESWVHPVLAHLEIAEPGAPETAIEIAEVAGALVIYVDTTPVLSCGEVSRLAPLVKQAVWQLAIRAHEFFLNIHAGAVGDGRRCILLPAAPGSGKSSLTAALCHAGLQYFSDEVALIEDGSFHVRPMPLAICVKSTGWDLLAPLFPELAALRAHVRGDGKIVRYLPPPGGAMPRDIPLTGLPADTLVFPRHRPGAETRLDGIAKGDALQRLMTECLTVAKPLDVDRVDRLVHWIKTTDCYQIQVSDLAEAVELIRALP